MVVQKVSLFLATINIDIPAFYDTSVYVFAGFTNFTKDFTGFTKRGRNVSAIGH